jgi:hypothetical protein
MKEIFPGCFAMGMDEFVARSAQMPIYSDNIADILSVDLEQKEKPAEPAPDLSQLCPGCEDNLTCPTAYKSCPWL